ncbi:MAG TPA: hypothetical protein PLP16_11795 [Smithellaceae bacterium]|nr:hypothetical protein [Smithellaceae bacterium]
MKPENYLESSQQRIQMKKPEPSLVYEMLTTSEIEQLMQSAKDANDYFQKEFDAEKNL